MEDSSGTVTFLFTDIEGSTRLWQLDEEAMRAAVARHDAVLQAVISEHGGAIFSTMGDGVAAVFSSAARAVTAAGQIQRRLEAETWPTAQPIMVRIGLNSGEADVRQGDYFGSAVNRAARVMAIAHGGQVLCSGATAGLLAQSLPEELALRDLGSHRLRDLTAPEHIHQLVVPGLPEDFARLRSLDALPGNLPMQATAFIGRAEDVKELTETIFTARVVTLTGVGGVGKTRLALQAAAEVLPSFRDGVWLVELAGVGSPEAVRDAVASSLGAQAGPLSGGLEDYLQSKESLLILDNCEHLLGEVAGLAENVVSRAPDIRILATSREGLGVTGEHLVAVASMGLPEPGAEAGVVVAADSVRLFVERATEASATFRLTDEDAAVVAEVCRRLDGIPLAIELAAARVPALTPAEIASHLDRRFKLLTGGRRTALPRQQTLRNAIEWSYQLLDVDEQVVLGRLSVFAGDFDLSAAKYVAGSDGGDALEVLDVLVRLVAKSLLVAEPRGATTRYRLLETVREFAWERLGESDDVNALARRHAEFYAAFAKEAGTGLRGPSEPHWRDRMELEQDNLRAALTWAISAGETALALRPVADLSLFGDRIAPYGLLAEQAGGLDEEDPLAAVAFGSAAFAASLQGDGDRAQSLSDRAWSCADSLGRSPDDLWVRCRVANGTCIAMSSRSDWGEFGRQWLVDARELADDWNLCEALTFQTVVEDLDEAVTNGEEALSLARRFGSPSRISFAAVLLAGRMTEIDPSRAKALLAEASEAGAAAHNDWVDFTGVPTLCMAQISAGDRRAACETLVEAMERWAPRGAPGTVIQFAAYLANLLHLSGDSEGALVLAAWSERRGVRLTPDNAMVVPFGVGEFHAYCEGLSPAEREQAEQTSAALDDLAVVAYARGRLSKVG